MSQRPSPSEENSEEMLPRWRPPRGATEAEVQTPPSGEAGPPAFAPEVQTRRPGTAGSLSGRTQPRFSCVKRHRRRSRILSDRGRALLFSVHHKARKEGSLGFPGCFRARKRSRLLSGSCFTTGAMRPASRCAGRAGFGSAPTPGVVRWPSGSTFGWRSRTARSYGVSR